jgi:outer membrane lipoprotein carrier protein
MRLRCLRGMLALVLWAALGVQTVWASSGRERLDWFFERVSSLDATFTQEVYDEKGTSLQHATGRVELARPGRLRWEYQTPDRQLIVADGERLWTFDEELEQATVKPLDEALGSAPVMLLTRRGNLDQEYEVREVEGLDGLNWVEISPRAQDTEFDRIRIGLDERGIRQMVLFDRFGQKTVIRFDRVRTNIAIPPAEFRFDPPPGVDVIGDSG